MSKTPKKMYRLVSTVASVGKGLSIIACVFGIIIVVAGTEPEIGWWVLLGGIAGYISSWITDLTYATFAEMACNISKLTYILQDQYIDNMEQGDLKKSPPTSSVEREEAGKPWACIVCGQENDAGSNKCKICDTERKVSEDHPENN